MLANLSALDQNKGVKPISYLALILVALIGSASNGTAQAAKDRPVLLYSRYFNAPGENRYLPDGNFKDVLDLARKEFQVKVHDKPLTAESLTGVNVVLIASYTLGCHSLRHLNGGRKDALPRGAVGKNCYDCVSALNRKHMFFAWCSLFSVGLTDLYVRLCAMSIISDYRIL